MDAPSQDTINICAEQERAEYKQKHPSLEFYDHTIVNELRSTPGATRDDIMKSPARYESSASRFKAILKQQRKKRLGARATSEEKEDETLTIEQDEGEEDNPFNPVNESKVAKGEEEEEEDSGEEEDSDDEDDSEDDSEDAETTAREDASEFQASHVEKVKSDEDSSDSSEESDSDDSDDSDSSNESDQNGQREEDSVPNSIPGPIQPSPSKSPSKRVSFVQQTSIRTFRRRRVLKVEDISESEDDLRSHTQESQQPLKSELDQLEQPEESEEQFEDAEEQFETAPDHLDKGKEVEDGPEEEPEEESEKESEAESEEESEREKTPTKSRPGRTPVKTPTKSLTEVSASPKSPTSSSLSRSPTTATPPAPVTPEKRGSSTPTPASSNDRKRRRVLLDDDDGFDDGVENEFSRERQAEFFLQSDDEDEEEEGEYYENEDEDEDGEELDENGVQVKGEEDDYTAAEEFDDEFQLVQPRRRGRNSLKGGEKGRPRDKFTPAKDRLLLESTEAAKRLAIPLKVLFKQLTSMIGHTEYSLQTRLSRLEGTESLREIASEAPVIEEAPVSEVISRIMHKTQQKTGPKPRARIPYTDLDDLAIKAFVCDLDPSKRGSYGAYEPFAEKYTHHDASSVKGRWTKTLGPRTNEIELLEAKQSFTPELEKQYLDWLHSTYPALFQR